MVNYALDTETLNGFARVVATNEEYKEVNSFQEILDFILQKKHRAGIIWTWNLRYDVQAILKHLLAENKENWREITNSILLKDGGKGYNYHDKTGRLIKIKYIQSKQLVFSYSKHVVKFYDIAQFYGHEKLDNAAKKYLGKQKIDYANWVNRCIEFQKELYTLEEMEEYLNKNIDDIGKYCQLDADLTLQLAGYMEKGFLGVNIPFDKPMSQAKIAEEFIKNRAPYPMVPESMEHIHDLARLTYHGGIFETLQRGMFEDEIYDYDINSAYPCTMSTLPHWGNGKFTPVETQTDNIKYGWYKVKFNCRWIPYEDRENPYLEKFSIGEGAEQEYVLNNKRIVYPEGERTQFITRIELDFLIKNHFKHKVLGGVEWEQNKRRFDSPFNWMEETFYKRLEIKNNNSEDMRQYALKITLNSSYGKTAQQEPFIGALTNFFYASYITADTRIKLAQIAEDNPKNVIDIATDGICLNKPVKGLKVGENLGEYKLSIFPKALFIGSGIRQMFYEKPDKKGNTYETFARGLTNDKSYNMLADIENNLKSPTLEKTKIRPLNLGECLTHTKVLDIKDLNIFTPVTKKLNVNTDKKHKWTHEYTDFEDFLLHKSDGKPLIVKELEGSR